jgi:ABC-2 type transport system permease protein
VVTLVAIYFLRDRGFGASGFTLGALVLPSVLGMFIALGMLLTVQYLTAEREDGTLLRAKAIPNGIGGYFIGKLVTVSGTILAYLAILLVPGLLIVDGLGTAASVPGSPWPGCCCWGWWRPSPSAPRWGRWSPAPGVRATCRCR